MPKKSSKSPAKAEISSLVGTDILSYCTSCKMDLGHVIVSMKGDKAAKVQCRTCDKEHLFRAPKGITEPPVKKTRAKKSDSGLSGGALEVEWQKLMSLNETLQSKKYSMKGTFLLGDKVEHPNFGVGIVGRLVFPNKIEVVFKDDLKLLIHAGIKD